MVVKNETISYLHLFLCFNFLQVEQNFNLISFIFISGNGSHSSQNIPCLIPFPQSGQNFMDNNRNNLYKKVWI